MNEKEKTSENVIGQDFDLWGLVKYTTPSILMQICTQLFQTLDDGLFVSRYVGQYGLAAINLMSPLLFVRMAVNQLFSMGAATISAEKMGEGDQEGAKQVFTKVAIAAVAVGVLFAVLVNLFALPICSFLGADENTLDSALIYLRIVFGATPVHLLAVVLMAFYPTCGTPKMGLFCSVLNGTLNIVLDVVFITIMKLGITGSSWSTVIGDVAVCLAGVIFYFMKKHEIHFVRPRGEFLQTLRKSFSYSSSQFVSSLSFGIYNYVTNAVILSLTGPDGIAANAIVSDLRRILNAAVTGYASCVAPIVAYNAAGGNHRRLKRIFDYNLTYWFFMSALVTFLGLAARKPLIGIFFKENYSQYVWDLTYEGLSIEFSGISLTTGYLLLNNMFVALNETKVASFVSFMRNIVLRVIFTLALPVFFQMTGIWLSFTVSEVFAFGLSLYFFLKVITRFGISGRSLRFAFHEE